MDENFPLLRLSLSLSPSPPQQTPNEKKGEEARFPLDLSFFGWVKAKAESGNDTLVKGA